MKILQNREQFSCDAYRAHAVPLVQALENSPFGALKRWRKNGFAAGVLMYLLMGRYDAVVTVGHRAACTFGAMRRIFGERKIPHLATEFFFEDEGSKASVRQRLLRLIYRFVLKKVDTVVVNASGEIVPYARLFALPESRFRFIPWPSNIDNPAISTETDNSILAVGRSLRDWDALFKAVEGLPYKTVVVASAQEIRDLEIPVNVEVHLDIPRNVYLGFLERAAVVVIPLIETIRSTGQASFLEAMAYGKPVIVTDVVGARDYIIDGQNGLTYRPGDQEDLRRKIVVLMQDDALRRKLAQAGLQSIATRFNRNEYAREFLAHCRSLVDGKRNAGAGRQPLAP